MSLAEIIDRVAAKIAAAPGLAPFAVVLGAEEMASYIASMDALEGALHLGVEVRAGDAQSEIGVLFRPMWPQRLPQ